MVSRFQSDFRRSDFSARFSARVSCPTAEKLALGTGSSGCPNSVGLRGAFARRSGEGHIRTGLRWSTFETNTGATGSGGQFAT